MNLLDKIGREFSGYNLLESGKRIFDRKPLQCSLYLTDKCNLDCSYCTEYDNSKPHPKLEDLKLWIRKIRDGGAIPQVSATVLSIWPVFRPTLFLLLLRPERVSASPPTVPSSAQ